LSSCALALGSVKAQAMPIAATAVSFVRSFIDGLLLDAQSRREFLG
jgi:hypothetical protein